MKVIVAGTRTFRNYDVVKDVLDKMNMNVTEIVSGRCRAYDETGAELLTPDTMGEKWANENGIPIKPFPADWEEYGRYAGPIRNKQMAEYADYAVVFWDGQSKGSRDMIRKMTKLGKQVMVHVYDWKKEKDATI